MSLWTPDGDHPVPPRPAPAPPESAPPRSDQAPPYGDLPPEEQARLAAMQAEMEEVRRELLAAPAAVVVANHAMGMYELAAIHLMSEPPQLVEASLAVDALAALVEGLEGRLGDAEPTLRDALGQLRAASLDVHNRAVTPGSAE